MKRIHLVLKKKLRSLKIHADTVLTGGAIRKRYYFFLGAKSLKLPFTHRAVLSYDHKSSYLHELLRHYGSDKGSPCDESHPLTGMPSHTYADLYLTLFEFARNHVTKIFECGIGTNNLSYLSNMGEFGKPGASLRAWKHDFPNAEIYGADIDPDILFTEQRIRTFHVDQTDAKSVKNMWESIGSDNFDVIIDDGLHTFDAGISLFRESIGKLRSGGIYIIEDIGPEEKIKFAKFFSTGPYRFTIVDLHRPFTWLLDNSVVLIWK